MPLLVPLLDITDLPALDQIREDFTEGDETYDVIFDAVGKLEPSRGKKALKTNGIYLNVNKDSASGGGGQLGPRVQGPVHQAGRPSPGP